MAQPNVAREPSMDEILASIRKIIESNEPGLPAFPANDMGAPSAFRASPVEEQDVDIDDIHLTIDDEELAAEFAAEEQRLMADPQPLLRGSIDMAPQVEMPTIATQTAPPPQSLADVAARVRAASERNTLALRSSEPEAAHRSSEATADVAEAPKLASASMPRVEVSAVPAVSAVVDQDVTAIVSPEVGAQVARSFDDLAQALDAGPRRSFDEIAEDMLRPMLQEWLDDNLPTLVERLVREEIERVARGPRRG